MGHTVRTQLVEVFAAVGEVLELIEGVQEARHGEELELQRERGEVAGAARPTTSNGVGGVTGGVTVRAEFAFGLGDVELYHRVSAFGEPNGVGVCEREPAGGVGVGCVGRMGV